MNQAENSQKPGKSDKSEKTEHDLPLPSASTAFAGNIIEFLQFFHQQIVEEESFKNILKRFVTLLSDYFGLTHAVYVHLSHEDSESGMKRAPVRFPPTRLIDDSALGAVQTAMKSLLGADSESRTGVCTLHAGGVDYFFAIIAETAGQEGALIWRQPPLTVRSPLLRHLKDQPDSMMPVLDFMVRHVQQACRWLKRLDSTQAMLYQDEVTGLYNYRYLDVAIDGELRRLQRFHAPFSLLFIDLDNFKEINDRHGHLTGSSVLRQAGESIKAAVRDVDSVIRYGGDEFVVVLLGTSSRQALQAAERVRHRVASAIFMSEDRSPIRITASIGVASCPEHGKDRTTILKLADETMYLSKKSGKNRVMMVPNSTANVTPAMKEQNS